MKKPLAGANLHPRRLCSTLHPLPKPVSRDKHVHFAQTVKPLKARTTGRQNGSSNPATLSQLPGISDHKKTSPWRATPWSCRPLEATNRQSEIDCIPGSSSIRLGPASPIDSCSNNSLSRLQLAGSQPKMRINGHSLAPCSRNSSCIMEQRHPSISTHCPLLALASTPSQTFWVCSAQRKSGCTGLPVSRLSKKSARALMNVCS